MKRLEYHDYEYRRDNGERAPSPSFENVGTASSRTGGQETAAGQLREALYNGTSAMPPTHPPCYAPARRQARRSDNRQCHHHVATGAAGMKRRAEARDGARGITNAMQARGAARARQQIMRPCCEIAMLNTEWP